jgi:hypothetical protein
MPRPGTRSPSLRPGTALLLLTALPHALGAQTPAQSSADAYTRYELATPGSGAFRIVYDVTATTPGARWYLNGIRAGAEEEVHSVTDGRTGRPLEWEVVGGATARTRGVPGAADEDRFVQVLLPRPVPAGGETRVRIDKTYVDPASYFDEPGEIVFDRSLGVERNAVVLPAGYELIAVNVPSQVDTEPDGRIRVSFLNASGLPLRYRVRARALPAEAAAALAARAAAAPEAGREHVGEGGGIYDGSYARTGRAVPERAAQTREIVYFLEQPESRSFTLYHDYTESRPGQDRYLNVVRAGSAAADPRAFLLDTGDELPVETVRGAEAARRGLVAPDGAGERSEVIVVRFPAVAEGTSARIRIHETYTDSSRYTMAGDELVWDRHLGRARNQVVLPQGWFLTASDQPAAVDPLDDGRVRLTFWDGGPDGLQVFLRARRRAQPVARPRPTTSRR